MNTGPVVTLLFAFLGLYPIATGALWMAGGLLHRVFDEPTQAEPPPGGWPGVTILIPAYNEGKVIATCVHAARAVDYPELEVLVLDDGVDGRHRGGGDRRRRGRRSNRGGPRSGQPRQG